MSDGEDFKPEFCMIGNRSNLQASLVDLLCKLINCSIGRSTHQDRATCLLHQLVYNGG